MPSAKFAPPRPWIARNRSNLFVLAVGATLALVGLGSQAGAQCSGTGTATYNSSTGVNNNGTNNTVTSTITVPSLPAGSTITCISVVLNGVTTDGQTYSSMDYAAFMLTAPSGQKLEFLGATGDGTDGDDNGDSGSGLSNVGITVADNAGPDAPAYPATWPHTGGVAVKPSSYYNYGPNNETGGPPLGSSTEWAQSDGTATFTTEFVNSGATASGTWTLSLKDTNDDPVSAASWTLVMTTHVTANASTTTALASSSTNNTSFTSGANSSVTLTATVSSTSTVNVGTVNFTDGGASLAGCSAKPVSSGQATCTITLSTEGIHGLDAAYSGGSGFNPSSSPGLNQFVKNHSTLSGGNYCNSGAITENGSISPYPSVINVGTDTSSLGGSVAGVTVTLKGLSDGSGLGPGYAYLLVAPDRSHAYDLDFLSNAASSGNQSSVNVSFADGFATAPQNGALGNGVTYEATDYDLSADTFAASTSPAPTVPGTINYAQPDFFGTGGVNFAGAFGGANGAGDWALFAYNGTGTPINVSNGWCLAFEVNNGAPTTTTLVSSVNPAYSGAAVTLTATVTSTSTVNSGTLTIVDNTTGTTLASGTPSGGVVEVLTASLTEGDHDIVATYSGVSNIFDPSSATLFQRIDHVTTVSGKGIASSPALFCNAGGITLPSPYIADNIGPASPNPSNIFTTNLPGTLNQVEVELNGLHTADPVITDTATLLVGANGSGLDFFSETGAVNSTLLSNGSYDFQDGGLRVPQSNFVPGTYAPTAYGSTPDTFFSSPSGFYTLPGTIHYAAPHGASTLASVFESSNPIGTWSLYFNQNIHDTGAGATNWCLSVIDNPVSVTPAAGHSGSFIQGQTNQQITLDVTNNGAGPTGDPDGTNPLTVTDILPAGLSFTSASGAGWSCSGTSTATCTNHSAIAQGSAFLTLTLNVTVANNATLGNVNNSFSVSGDGVTATTSNTDSIKIEPAPVLSVTKTHTGTFTQGQANAEWDIAVNNTASGGSTYGTVTVSDALPSGYTVSSFTASGWSCSGTGASGNPINCTSTLAEPGGSSFPTIQVFMNVPAASPTSVSNTAFAWGGGDLNHTNSGNAATGTDFSVPVVQVPASITIDGGSGQSAPLATAFASPLFVTVKDANNATIPNSPVTFTAPASGASGIFSNSGITITTNTDVNGVAYAGTGIFTANTTLGGYQVSAADSPAPSVNFSLTNLPGLAASFQITVPPTAVSGTPFSFTVTAYDAYSNVANGYSGTATFTSSDTSTAVSLPAPSPLPNGTGTFSATLATPGSQTITAVDSAHSLSITSSGIAVSAPNLVVNQNTDDAGSAGNCSAQPTPGTTTNSDTCSLRDALAFAANAGAANISFDATVFAPANTAAQNTITLGVGGTLNMPSNTAISGATSGSGYGLSNLVTVSGNNATTVFTEASGVAGASISGLIITNGFNSQQGGGIFNSGTLTLSNNTISGNSANASGSGSAEGGGIYNQGTLTVNNCTISGNTATISGSLFENSSGGGIFNYVGTLTLSDSTISGNTATAETNSTGTAGATGGGIQNSFGTLILKNSTVSGNSAVATGGSGPDSAGGGIDSSGGPSSLANSVVAGNIAASFADTFGSAYSDLGGNQVGVSGISLAPLGNYGGPTQTMPPLPGSPAICFGTLANATAAGITADQRGFVFDPNCPSGANLVDAGAVQTNYALAFTPNFVSTYTAGQAMTPAPAVGLTESGVSATVPTTSVSMADTAVPPTLGGTTSANLSAGTATFGNLVFSAAEASDSLTATMALTPTINLTASSPSFAVLAGQTISFTAPSPVTYGVAPITLSASSTSGLTVSFQLISGPATLIGSQLTITGAGSVVVEAVQAGNGVYGAAVPVQETITVNPAVLKIEAFSYQRTYGQTLPSSFGFAAYGFVNGDSAGTALSGSPSFDCGASTGSPAGTYPITITAGTLTSANYTFVFANGTLTISQAVLRVTAFSYTRNYGQALPTFGYSIGGFVNGDTLSVVSGAPNLGTTATSTPTVGTYPITPTLGTLSATNYTFTLVNGTLTINPAVLMVAAFNYSRYYRQVLPSAYGYSITGFVNGDTALSATSGAAIVTSTAVQGSNPGTYPITPTIGTLTAANYAFQFQAGTLTIVSPAVLTVTALTYTRTYGQALPTFGYSILGFVDGDTIAVVSGAPSISSTASSNPAVGSYTITPTLGTLSAAGYTFQFATGTLTVTPAVLRVAALSHSETYGTAPPALSYSVTGYVNGDTASAAYSGTPNVTTSASPTAPYSGAGSYPITVTSGTLFSTNYTFALINGTLTITPAVLEVAAFNYSRPQGAALPNPYGYSVSGYVNGDTAATAFTGTPSVTSTAVQGSARGPYPITAATGTLNSTNYTFGFVNGTLTIY